MRTRRFVICLGQLLLSQHTERFVSNSHRSCSRGHTAPTFSCETRPNIDEIFTIAPLCGFTEALKYLLATKMGTAKFQRVPAPKLGLLLQHLPQLGSLTEPNTSLVDAVDPIVRFNFQLVGPHPGLA